MNIGEGVRVVLVFLAHYMANCGYTLYSMSLNIRIIGIDTYTEHNKLWHGYWA